MATVPFKGRVLPGGLLVLDRPKDYARAVRALAGKFVEVTIRKQRTQRSLQQNAWMHGFAFPPLQDALGYETVEELKLALMGEFWGWKRDKLTGRDVPVKAHTSDMTTEECSRFMEWLPKFAAQLPTPVDIPLPNEVGWAA